MELTELTAYIYLNQPKARDRGRWGRGLREGRRWRGGGWSSVYLSQLQFGSQSVHPCTELHQGPWKIILTRTLPEICRGGDPPCVRY